MDSLDVTSHKQDIVQLVATHPVTIITGETGCGKSTQIPQYLLDSEKEARIVVTQPRRMAAVAMAERVS